MSASGLEPAVARAVEAVRLVRAQLGCPVLVEEVDAMLERLGGLAAAEASWDAFMESATASCSCFEDRPCDGVLAGGMCDRRTEPFEPDVDTDEWLANLMDYSDACD